MNRPIVIGTALFLLLFALLFYAVKRKAPEETDGSPKSAATEISEKPVPIQRRINVKLFFSDGSSALLRPEDRSIIYEEDLHAQAREILSELIKGPQSDLIATIPQGTQLRDLFISKDGVAYADFSNELAGNHLGGSAAEMDTVFSIVNTLTLNFPQIKAVQILIGDQAVDTLKGHVDLSRPLKQDLSLVVREPGQPVPEKAQQS